MRISRRHIVFLAILCLCLSMTYVFCWDVVENSFSILTSDVGTVTYDTVECGRNGLCAVAGWDRNKGDDVIMFRVFDLQGNVHAKRTVVIPEIAGGVIQNIYPYSDDIVFLTIYGKNAETVYIYRVKGNDVELLFSEGTVGRYSMERMGKSYVTHMTEEHGKLSFGILSQDGNFRTFVMDAAEGGLTAGKTHPGEGSLCALALPDGRFATAGNGFFRVNDMEGIADFSGQLIEGIRPTKFGWYYLEASGMEIWFTDLSGTSSQCLYSIDTALETLKNSYRLVTSADLTEGGEMVILVAGTLLAVVNEGTCTRIDGVLTYGKAAAVASLVGVALAAFLLTVILWLLICGRRRGYTPMVVTWGSILLAVTGVSLVVMIYGVIRPNSDESSTVANAAVVSAAEREVMEVLFATTGDTYGFSSSETQDVVNAVPKIMSAVLESSDGSAYRNVIVCWVYERDGKWYTESGARAELNWVMDVSMMEAAKNTKNGVQAVQKDDMFSYVQMNKDGALCVYLEDAVSMRSSDMEVGLVIRTLLMSLVSILVLLLVSRDLRRLAKEMERLSAGDRGRMLQLHTGDELESMATTVSGLAESLEQQRQAMEELSKSSRRFVPEQVLSLLGKQTIQEVDKQTMTVRRMVVMSLHFYLSYSFYTGGDNSRRLFEVINTIIERTAPIATKKGGTVFNFSYIGFEVVMEPGSDQVISTAVAIQQEVLAINEERMAQGLEKVVFRIALDMGDVLVGVVGDNEQMEPTMISSTFATVTMLQTVAEQVDARILCTEIILGSAKGYGSRYMGKCRTENGSIRVYEVFDGDPYEMRRGKAGTVDRFSTGIFALYSGDTVKAKRVFLDLAHDCPADGGVRYYLYLADRMTQDPELHCGLNLPDWDYDGGTK